MLYDTKEAHILNIKELLVPSKINYIRDFEVGLPQKSAKIRYDSGEYAEISDEIRNFYFGNASDGLNRSEIIRRVNDMLTDNFFAYGISQMARMYAEKSSGHVFFYQ